MKVLDAKLSKPMRGGASFSLRNRIFRGVWNLVWLLFASWTPPQLHGWRRLLLASFGAKLHKSARVYGSARIWYPPNLAMGEFAVMGPRVNCYCQATIVLGRRVVVSQGAHLCAGSHDIRDPDFQLITKPIVLEEDVWVAAEAFVGPGVVMRSGSVAGARAVIFKNTDDFGVYVGNPAMKIKVREFNNVGEQ